MGKQRLKWDELLHTRLTAAIGRHLLCDRTRALCRVFPGYMKGGLFDVKRLAERGTAPLTCRYHGMTPC
jgi:hypothetical protein